MKCPYRTIITERTLEYTKTLDTEFKECLYEECPYYQPERKDEKWFPLNEGCWKARIESEV